MAIDVPGGVSSTPAGAESYPVPSPEYADCSEVITASGSDAVLGLDPSMRQSYDGTQISFGFSGQWEGPQFTDEGIACGGVANYRGSLELRSGKYAQRLPDGKYVLRTRAQSPAIIMPVKRGSVDSGQMCEFAASARGRAVSSVGFFLREERTYLATGQPPVTTRDTIRLGSLSCAGKDRSGGVGAQHSSDSGAGGVSVK